MSVKIADKIVQYNNGSYFLMDSSAVEYIDKNGNSQSVKDILDNTSTDRGGSSEKQIKDWVSGSSYLEGDYIYHEGEIYRCLTSNSDVDFDESNWKQLTYGIDELSKEDVEGLLGLTEEEIEAMADLILDTEVRIDKTYSSSKIYTDIQQCLQDSKDFTLEELGTETLDTTSQTVKGAINELFQSVSNGKTLLASAITDKGVETLADATFETMAENIGGISSGGYSQTNSALGGKGLAVSGDESDEILSDVITDLFGLTTPLVDTTTSISRLDSTTVTTEDVAYDEELVRTNGWGLKFTTRKTSTGSVNESGVVEFDEINLGNYITELTIF